MMFLERIQTAFVSPNVGDIPGYAGLDLVEASRTAVIKRTPHFFLLFCVRISHAERRSLFFGVLNQVHKLGHIHV